MIISETQARLATECLRCQAPVEPVPHVEISSDLMDRVLREVADVPEMRAERIEEARQRLNGGTLDSRDVAEKMLSRIAADSLR